MSLKRWILIVADDREAERLTRRSLKQGGLGTDVAFDHEHT